MGPDNPPELDGAIGNVTGATVVSPLLAPAPLPGALGTSSPGLATAALRPPPQAPTFGHPDSPATLLQLQQMANALFGVTAPVDAAPVEAAPIAPPPPANAPQAAAAWSGNPFGGAPAFDGIPGFEPAFTIPLFDAPPAHRDPPREVPGQTFAYPTTFEQTPNLRSTGHGGFDPHVVRRDFPILEERVHGGKRLVWLDNAATTQKPKAVIDRISHYYEHENSNVHRAAHTLAARATDAYEKGRQSVRRFLNAPSTEEIIFVRGATEGINLIAQSWGRRNIGPGDEIVLSWLEHHANIVPWQMLAAEKGAKLRIAPVDDRGDVIVEEYERLFGPRTKLAAFTQVSNALGTVTPAREMIEIAHRHGARVLLDGAQAVSHMPVDVQALDADWYVFSGHKVFAPTGIGAVYGKRDLLANSPPWQGGGNMIADVTFEKTVYQPPPGRFEAGTGNIADAVGLGEALDYVMRIGMPTIERYEHELLVYAEEHLARVPGLRWVGHPRHKAGVLSFVLDGQRTEDVGAKLDKEGIAVRSGHHCAQPILRRFGHEASVRASLAFYNVTEDLDALCEALLRIQSGRPG